MRTEPVHVAEEVGGPDGHHDDEDRAGEIGGLATAQAGAAADEEQEDVDRPTDEGGDDLWIDEVGGAKGVSWARTEPMTRPTVMQGKPNSSVAWAMRSRVSRGGSQSRGAHQESCPTLCLLLMRRSWTR